MMEAGVKVEAAEHVPAAFDAALSKVYEKEEAGREAGNTPKTHRGRAGDIFETPWGHPGNASGSLRKRLRVSGISLPFDLNLKNSVPGGWLRLQYEDSRPKRSPPPG